MRISALALVLAVVAGPAGAWSWLSAPLPEDPEETSTDLPLAATASQCIAAIFEAQQRYGIPDNLLLALGLQEAGYRSPEGLTVWPWTVNAAGEGRYFASRAEAEAFVAEKLAAGVTSIDLGCLQINMRWHPGAFLTYSQGFDARVNVDYAARFLRGLYEESGDWWQAAGRYHSHSPQPQAVYLAALTKNLRVAQAQFGEGGDYESLSFAKVHHREPVPYRSEGAIWGADLAGEEGAYRSLYSAIDLEPVLPNFLAPEQ